MLSRSAEYAIRALAFLGAGENRPWRLSREIADELGMPSPFLAKVLHTLAARGLLESQRGRGGGFRLVREPREVTLLEVVEPFDHLADRTLCVLGQKICSEETACPLHHAWKAHLTAFLAALGETTLADIKRSANDGGYPWNPASLQAARSAVPQKRRGAKRAAARG